MKGEWIALLVPLALVVGGCSIGQQHDSVQSEAMTQQLNHDRWVQQELEDKLDEEQAATEEVALEFREQRKKNRVVYRDLMSARQEEGDLTQQVALTKTTIETRKAELAASAAEAEGLAHQVNDSKERVASLQREIAMIEASISPLEGKRVELASRESALRAEVARLNETSSRPAADAVSGPQAEDPAQMGANLPPAQAAEGRQP